MMSMKRAAIAALVLSATTFAGHDVFYGVGAGFSQNNSSYNATTVVQSSGALVSNSSIITGGEALKGFGFVGISGSLSEMLRGSIQADIGFDGLNKTVIAANGLSDASSTVNLKSGFYYGASARLSVIRGDYAPYLVAGVRVGQWSTTIDTTSTTYSPAATVDFSNTFVAPELGIGINVSYTDKLDGRMEYKYMFGSTNTQTVTTTTQESSFSLSPRQQSVQFSLVF